MFKSNAKWMFNSGAKILNQNKCYLIKYSGIWKLFFGKWKIHIISRIISCHNTAEFFMDFYLFIFSSKSLSLMLSDNDLCTASINDGGGGGGGDGGDCPVMYTISHVAYLCLDFHRYYELLTSNSRASPYFRFKNEVTAKRWKKDTCEKIAEKLFRREARREGKKQNEKRLWHLRLAACIFVSKTRHDIHFSYSSAIEGSSNSSVGSIGISSEHSGLGLVCMCVYMRLFCAENCYHPFFL